MSCSFLTFNVFSDLPTFRHLDRRLEIAADAIATHRPGVVALQEIVRASASGDIGRKLCDLVNRRCQPTEYDLQYAKADGLGEDEWKFEEGLALLSRYRRTPPEPDVIKYSSQVRIETSVGKQEYRLPDDRIAIHVRYELALGVELDAYVTHLTDHNQQYDGVSVRAAQARELAEWVRITSRPENTVLVGGDFNDVPESDAIRTLIDNGFIDLHAAAGIGPGYTNDRNDLDLEAEHAIANQRIDYIFMRPGSRAEFAINSVQLILDQPSTEPHGRWLWASDHFGVLAHIELG